MIDFARLDPFISVGVKKLMKIVYSSVHVNIFSQHQTD